MRVLAVDIACDSVAKFTLLVARDNTCYFKTYLDFIHNASHCAQPQPAAMLAHLVSLLCLQLRQSCCIALRPSVALRCIHKM
jgi:hypothetical protein